jgi:hypothetical protein
VSCKHGDRVTPSELTSYAENVLQYAFLTVLNDDCGYDDDDCQRIRAVQQPIVFCYGSLARHRVGKGTIQIDR